MENIKDIDRLNALTNPIGFGDKVIIDGLKYTVGQNIDGRWFIYTQDAPVACVSNGQVEFIYNLIKYKDSRESAAAFESYYGS